MDYNIPSPSAAANQATSDQLQIQMQRAQLQQQPARQQLLQIEAQRATMQLKQQQQFMQQAQQWKPQYDSMSDNMADLAMIAFKAGDVQSGQSLMQSSMLATQKAAQIANYQSLIEQRQINAQKANFDYMGRVVGGIQDQQTLDAANSEYERIYNQPSPYKGQQYSPELRDKITQQFLSLKDQFNMREKQLADQRAQEREQRISGHDQKMEEISQQRLNLEKERNDRLKRDGGGSKAVTAPNKDDRKLAGDLIKQSYPKLQGNDLEVATGFVAAEAKRLLRQNPALSSQQAAAQALISAYKSGYFKESIKPAPGLRGMLGQQDRTTSFSLQGKQQPQYKGNATWNGLNPQQHQQLIQSYQANKGKVINGKSAEQWFKETYGFLP